MSTETVPTISITDAAASELKRVWEEQQLPPEAILVVGVRGGGCSGFQNVLNITVEYDPEKLVVEDVNGIRVGVDKRSIMYVRGMTIGYHSDLTKRGFTFTNPHVKSTCGCGSSFSV